MQHYAGTTTLITGASKGIGAALAHELGARGADLVLVARPSAALEAVAEDVTATHGVTVDVIPADLFDRSAPQAITEELDRRDIVVDLLINNAGMGAMGPFLERPLHHQIDSVELNVIALMGLVRVLGPAMVDRGHGGIINVASVAGFIPMPYQASYGGSKAFVVSFTEALAEEVEGSGVRVLGVHPGPVDTSFFDDTTTTVHPKAVSAERIARGALDDFARGRSISFPGGVGDRLSASLPRFLSRRRVVKISDRFTRQAGLHEAARLEKPAR